MRRQLLLVLGLSGLMVAAAYGCGDDVNTTGSSDADGGSGGDGGTGGVPASTGNSPPTGNGGAGGDGGGGPTTSQGGGLPMICTNPQHVCDNACCNIEVTCGFMGACSQAETVLGIDLIGCGEMNAQCAGACLADASCQALASLVGGTPDPALIGCIAPCTGDCFGCAFQSCGVEANECLNDPTQVCGGFVQCVAQTPCADGDGACVQNCAAMNNNALTQALLDCAALNCSTACGLMGGGGGGGN